MISRLTEDKGQGEWESVHKCPKCGHIVNLDETDLRVIATGMISCPNCKWFGPTRIRIMEQVQR